jgi:hypothetical protein
MLITGLFGLALLISVPDLADAQNTTPHGKKEGVKKEQQKKMQTIPVEVAEPGKLPPGQQGKEVRTDREPGFERAGDKGRKEGWTKDEPNPKKQAKLRKEQKKREIELRRLEKQRSKDARKLEKQRMKEVRKLEKQRMKKNHNLEKQGANEKQIPSTAEPAPVKRSIEIK